MIRVSFKFEVRIMPLLASEIEKSINRKIPTMDHIDSIDAVIEIEYRGHGSVWFDIPVIIPVEFNNQVIQIVFMEFRQRQLIPGAII